MATIESRAPSRRFLALSTASGLALSAVMAAPVYAQEAPADDEAEEISEDGNVIIVSGFRASLEDAQNIKRTADTFVDAISAEDIGALPDRSVAEALQRVPGVNIGRFEKTTDPDRFSVEGTGVIIRGLPYVRSELNGREVFSATGGRVLSFNDVSPELLGRVEVWKNVTADMVEGAISGTVNLVTRKPLDNRGLKVAGSIEGSIGDLAEEWSPSFSGLVSNTWDSEMGTFGLQLGYSRGELVSRTDASQVSDPCYRAAPFTDTPCIRAYNVINSGGVGVGDPTEFTPDNFPPEDTFVIPGGAGVRSTRLERDREAFSGVAQWESTDGRLLVTAEYLRAETSFFTDEVAVLSQLDTGINPTEPTPGNWQFDENGVFQSGTLTRGTFDFNASPLGGIPTEFLRFQRGSKNVTEDLSFEVDYEATDRLRLSFEAQRISADLDRDSIIAATNTWTDVALDLTGSTPSIQFLAPQGAPADYFSSGFYSYYWFALDSVERNEADMDSLRFDAEYDISDEGFFKRARFGARWSDRERITRNTDFSTWGNLSAPWTGRAGCLPWGEGPNCQPGAPGTYQADWGQQTGYTPGRFYVGGVVDPITGTVSGGLNPFNSGGAYIDEFPQYSSLRDPFSDGFQRGTAPVPVGAAYYFGGDDLLGQYLDGTVDQAYDEIKRQFALGPEATYGVNGRSFTNPVTGETVACDPFCPPEISDVGEITKAAYGRVDFGHDFDSGLTLEGNFGLRYVETTIKTEGLIGFPQPGRFDDPVLDDDGNVIGGGNGDGIVQVSEIEAQCQFTAPGQVAPGFCDPIFAPRLADFAAAHTGEVLVDDRDIKFENWLPSFNAKLDLGNGLLFRAAVSKGISRPDLQLFRAGGFIGDNTAALRQAGTLTNGPMFAFSTGNRNLRPIRSWNYDLSAEWYFDDVGSLTFSVFYKDIKGIVDTAFDTVSYTSPSGVDVDVEVEGPANDASGKLKGFEITHQQTYDFLPGLLSGLGSQFTYTYVDGGDFTNPNFANPGEPSVPGAGQLNATPFAFLQPLSGISKHTVNATVFYEKGPLAMRAAYNWRSDFVITPRDDIFPYSPIWQESTGQLDASIFYDVTDYLKLGIQGVNLLDEITETSSVIDYDGTRIQRSAFRNDRRYTFIARFNF